MIICEKLGFVFVRNPKTATRSITRAFKSLPILEFGHYHEAIVPEQYQKLKVYCVVRHPFERIVSAYCNRVYGWEIANGEFKERMSKAHSWFVGPALSFRDYIFEEKDTTWGEQYKTTQHPAYPVHYIKYENLKTELRSLFFWNGDLPLIGENPQKIDIELDQETKREILNLFQTDFDKFNYTTNFG
jgi:hypothetical protein